MAELPWWAEQPSADGYRPDNTNRQSLMGTTPDRRNSWFYYDSNNQLAETADHNTFIDESTGLWDVMQNDYRQFPIERASGFADPWKQNNVMDIFRGSMEQVMDYSGIGQSDVEGRAKIMRYYGFDRPEGVGGFLGDMMASTSKMFLASQDVSGSYGTAIPGDASPVSAFANGIGVPIQPGDASAVDIPLLFKEYAKTGNMPNTTEMVDLMYALEARSSRMYRELSRFDPEFKSERAWDNLSETQRKMLESEGYDKSTWMANGLERANNAMDYFIRTEKFIRDRVYASQLEEFANKSTTTGFYTNSLASWGVNSFVNDMDNLIFTAATLPAGGWQGKAALNLGILRGMEGALSRLGVLVPIQTRTMLIEGAALGAGQSLGASVASTDLYNTFNIGEDVDVPSYSSSLIYGAMAGAAFVAGFQYLPRIISGLSLKAISKLPTTTQTKLHDTPLVGNLIFNMQARDSLRKILSTVGADADQFYLYDYLPMQQAALLMHDESLGRSIIIKTLISKYGDNAAILKKFDKFFSREYLHENNVGFQQLGDRIAMLAAEMDTDLVASPDTLVRYLDDFVSLQKRRGAKDIAEFRKSHALALEAKMNENLGDIRYNEAKPLNRADRNTIAQLSNPITRKPKESPEAFSNREFKRRLKLASYLARSENVNDLTKALEILREAKKDKSLPEWGDVVIKRLRLSIEDVSAKSDLERRIIRLERLGELADQDRGVKYSPIPDQKMTVKQLIAGLKSYRKASRKVAEEGFEGSQAEYLKIVQENHQQFLDVLAAVDDKKLFDYRGRGEISGDLKAFREDHESKALELGLPPDEVEKSFALEFLEALDTLQKARKTRDSEIAKAAQHKDMGKRNDLRDDAIRKYLDTKTKTITQFATLQPNEVESVSKATIRRELQDFSRLSSESKEAVLQRLFSTLEAMGAEPGDGPNMLIRMVKDTPLHKRFQLMMSHLAQWPQAQRNTFLNHVAAIRGLAVLHDDSPSFAGTFRTLGNPVSLRAASYSAIADAMQVITRGLRIKERYGAEIKAAMNTHLFEIRQAGKQFTLDTLPEQLKPFGEQMVKDLQEWNDATTAYFTNVLTAGHEVGLIHSGINPARYIPHRLPGDMTIKQVEDFVDKFTALRVAQFTDQTALDLTTLEAKGWIVRTEDGESFMLPINSPFRFLGKTVDEQIDALRELVKSGTRGIEELQRLQPKKAALIPSKNAGPNSTASHLVRTKREKDPKRSYTLREFRNMVYSKDVKDRLDLIVEMNDGLYDGAVTEAEKIDAVDAISQSVGSEMFRRSYWRRSDSIELALTAEDFAKISPMHAHVQDLWQQFGVLNSYQQKILRAAYVHVPESVIGLRVLRSDQNDWAFANRRQRALEGIPGATASVFLHETGHFVMFRKPELLGVFNNLLKSLSHEELTLLLHSAGLRESNQIRYAMMNADELGAVLWDTYMTANASVRIAHNSPKKSWMVRTIVNIFNTLRDYFRDLSDMEKLGQKIFSTFDTMDEASIVSLENTVSTMMKNRKDNLPKTKVTRQATELDHALYRVFFKNANSISGNVLDTLNEFLTWQPRLGTSDVVPPTEFQIFNVGLLGELADFYSNIVEGLAENVPEKLANVFGSVLTDFFRNNRAGLAEVLSSWAGVPGIAAYHRLLDSMATSTILNPGMNPSKPPATVREWLDADQVTVDDIMKKARSSIFKQYRSRGVSRDDAHDVVMDAYLKLISPNPKKEMKVQIEDAIVLDENGAIDAKKTRSNVESFVMSEAKKIQLTKFRATSQRTRVLKDVIFDPDAAAYPDLTPTELNEAYALTKKGAKELSEQFVAESEGHVKKTVQKAKIHLERRDAAVRRHDATKEVPPIVEPITVPPEAQEILGPDGTETLVEAIREGDLDTAAVLVNAVDSAIDAKALDTAMSAADELEISPDEVADFVDESVGKGDYGYSASDSQPVNNELEARIDDQIRDAEAEGLDPDALAERISMIMAEAYGANAIKAEPVTVPEKAKALKTKTKKLKAAVKPQEAPAKASEAKEATATPPKAETPPAAVKTATGGGGKKRPPTHSNVAVGGIDPEWFFKRKQFMKELKDKFLLIRDHWHIPGVLPESWAGKDLAKEYRQAFRSSEGYTPEFRTKHKNKTGVQVAAERYVSRMTNRSLGRGSAVDMRDVREAVRRNSRPDSIEGEDRVFSDADFSTPEGMAVAREFGLLNDLDSLVKDYAKSSGTRINAQLMLQAMMRSHLPAGDLNWNGKGLTYADIYDSFENSLKTLLATNADGSVGRITEEDNEMAVHVSDQFREKYLRSISKFPSQDQDVAFNKVTQLARNMTLNILGPIAAPTIMGVEVPIALARSIGMDPKHAAQHATALLVQAFDSSLGKLMGRKMSHEMLEDMVFFVEGLDSSPLNRLTGSLETVGEGHTIATTMWERFKQNVRRTANTLKTEENTAAQSNKAMNFLVAATQTTSQLGADIAGMRWATDLTRWMGARQSKREIIRFLPNLKKFRTLWDEMAIETAANDDARRKLIRGWCREAGLPYYVWNRASRKGLLDPGMLESVESLFPNVTWGKDGSRATSLNLNGARDLLLGLDEEASLMNLDPKGNFGIADRRKALTGVHAYIEEGVTGFSPELRGIYKLDRQDQLTPWKRLLFFWQNYPMAFFNVNVQQAFRNQRVPMALGNIMGLYVLEIQARMARDILLADNEEKRKEAIGRWKNFVTLDPTAIGSELMQGAPMVPLLGASQWMLTDLSQPVVSGFLPKESRLKYFPKTFGSSPVMGVVNRIYKTAITNPLKGLQELTSEGKTDRLQKAAWDGGNLMLDTIPLVNSWGRAAWNLGNAAFVKDATASPWGAAMPPSVGTWIEAFATDHISKKDHKPNTGVPAPMAPRDATNGETPRTGSPGSRMDPNRMMEESLRRPIGR